MPARKPRQRIRHTNRVYNVVHLQGGRRIITCSDDGSLRLWDLESGTQIGDDWRDGAGVPMFAMTLSPNGGTVATASDDGTIRLWDVETGKVKAKWTGHTGPVWSIRWSADSKYVVSGSSDGTASVWDVESGKTVLSPIKTGHNEVYAAIYSPNRLKIATGGSNEDAVKIWDAKTGVLLSTFAHNTAVWSLAWTSDQRNLLSGSGDGLIRIFNTATLIWRETARLKGHKGGVSTISLFRSDRLFVSTSWDKTARLWNLDTNCPVGPLLRHGADVNCAAISTSGELLVTGCDDHNAYVWDAHTILRDTGLEDLLYTPYANELVIMRDLSEHITKVGDYPVARGGFGEIWKCLYQTPEGLIPVAVKALLVYATDQLEGSVINEKKVRRIWRELKTGAKLRHENILPMYGYTYGFGKFAAIVTPWAEKGSLLAYFEVENAALTPIRRFKILRDISAGLHYLHANDVVHGDLSGPNVLIRGDGTACLCDFGLSLILSEVMGSSSVTSTVRGNCRWMAPELFNAHENEPLALPSKISDIYSFGGIMLYVLTGQVPYYYLRNEAQVINAIINRVNPYRSRYSPVADKHWYFIEQCWKTVAQDRPTIGQVDQVINAELYFMSVIEPCHGIPSTHNAAAAASGTS